MQSISDKVTGDSQRDWWLTEVMATWVHGLRPWQCIGHFTFKWEAGIGSAQRCFEKFMDERSRRGVSYFYSIEPNPGRPGHHLHALLYAPVEPFRKFIWQDWFERYGRNRIEPVRSHEDVTSYVAKYVVKKDCWWNVELKGRAFHFTPAAGDLTPVNSSVQVV